MVWSKTNLMFLWFMRIWYAPLVKNMDNHLDQNSPFLKVANRENHEMVIHHDWYRTWELWVSTHVLKHIPMYIHIIQWIYIYIPCRFTVCEYIYMYNLMIYIYIYNYIHIKMYNDIIYMYYTVCMCVWYAKWYIYICVIHAFHHPWTMETKPCSIWSFLHQPRFDASPSTAHHHGDFHHSVLQSPMASRLEGLGQDVPKCVGSVMLYVHVADLLIQSLVNMRYCEWWYLTNILDHLLIMYQLLIILAKDMLSGIHVPKTQFMPQHPGNTDSIKPKHLRRFWRKTPAK